MIKPVPHIAAMTPYALADLQVPHEKRPISMAQNECLRPPSPVAVEAASKSLENAALYPDPDWNELRAIIAEVHNVPAKNLLCGTGSMELIACIAHAYLEPGTRALSSQYGYAFFKTVTQFTNAPHDVAPEVNFTVSIDSLLAAVKPDTKIVFVANPGNPTATRISRVELLRLRDKLADNILLVIDEAYGEFADGIDEPMFDLAERGNVIILRTLSKAYGLAGMRVGWGLFPEAIGTEVRKLLNPNNVSIASQASATGAMRDQAYMRETCKQTAVLREAFIEKIRAMNIATADSFTNFVLLAFTSETVAKSAFEALRSEGILMRGMAGYGLPQCLRATICREPDMRTAIEVLKMWHSKGKST